MNGPCKKCYRTAANRAQDQEPVVGEKPTTTLWKPDAVPPELFLDGFCLTDKRGKWYKEATFCDTSTTTYRTY
jgi:hypothetical protein